MAIKVRSNGNNEREVRVDWREYAKVLTVLLFVAGAVMVFGGDRRAWNDHLKNKQIHQTIEEKIELYDRLAQRDREAFQAAMDNAVEKLLIRFDAHVSEGAHKQADGKLDDHEQRIIRLEEH